MAFFLFAGQVNELLAPESLTRIPRISFKLSVLVIFAAVHVLSSAWFFLLASPQTPPPGNAESLLYRAYILAPAASASP